MVIRLVMGLCIYSIDDMERLVYPNVDIHFKTDHVMGEIIMVMDTYLRKKHHGRYYFEHHFREVSIYSTPDRLRLMVDELNHFHAGIYKSGILGRVDLKMVIPGHWEPPKRFFELDTDQRSEEERLTPDI